MSIITFNKSTIDKNDFITNTQPYQIVPLHDRFFYKDYLLTLPKCNNSNILIHASFTTRPFSSKQYNLTYSNVHGYELIADQLGTKYILFHGPSNPDEYNNYLNGLEFIDKCMHNKKVCIEIPAFSSALRKLITDYYVFIDEYLNTVIQFNNEYRNNQFQIVIDTAHLHANGLDGKEMVKLLCKYKDHYDFIHLNGNIKDKFNPDVHTPIDSINDKITDSWYVLEQVVKLNKICVCETKDGDYEYYDDISNEYGYRIVDRNKSYTY